MPLFKDRISPHFCTSVEVLLLDVERNVIQNERNAYWEELMPSEKIEKLKQWGVHTLLCGGITSFNKRKLEALHIEVVSELRGGARKILDQWLRKPKTGQDPPRKIAGVTTQGPVPS